MCLTLLLYFLSVALILAAAKMTFSTIIDILFPPVNGQRNVRTGITVIGFRQLFIVLVIILGIFILYQLSQLSELVPMGSVRWMPIDALQRLGQRFYTLLMGIIEELLGGLS